MAEFKKAAPLDIRCTSADCENEQHCFKQLKKMTDEQRGKCRYCGADLVDWDLRVRRRSVPSGPGGLVATLLSPQGRKGNLAQCHRVSLCSHRSSSPPPYSNSKGRWCLSHVGRKGSGSDGALNRR